MNNDERGKGLVPRLRFSGFEGEWLLHRFSSLYDFKRTNSLSRDKLNYTNGTIKNIHYGDIHTKFRTIFHIADAEVPYINPEISEAYTFTDDEFCEEGDLVLADASEDMADIGKAIEIVSLEGQKVVAGTHTILASRRGNEPILGFGGYLFQSPAVRIGIQKQAQGTKVFGISPKRISSILLPLPPSTAEQQRIADCLSSLNDLIAAEARKLEALRAHKKGLMQQLFPREGETVPRLRFPGFEGEWRLGKIAELFLSNERPEKAEHFDSDKILTVKLHVNGVVRNERTSILIGGANYFKRRAGQFIFSKIDLLNGAFGIIPDELDGFFSSSDVPAFSFNFDHSPTFFMNWLSCNYRQLIIERTGTSATLKRVSPEKLMELPIPLPTLPEQQRIADCLSSLDDLIAAQARKVELLKQHKKGLMQQLFPRAD